MPRTDVASMMLWELADAWDHIACHLDCASLKSLRLTSIELSYSSIISHLQWNLSMIHPDSLLATRLSPLVQSAHCDVDSTNAAVRLETTPP